MAQGDLTMFEEFSLNIANGIHDLDTDTFKVMLVTEGVSTITAADLTPDSTDYTEVSGTGYTAGGESLTVTWTEVGGLSSFKVTSGTVTWTQNGAGPATIKTAIVYNTSAASSDAICFIDMTADGGTTPVSTQTGDVTLTFSASGIFTLS